MSGRAGVGMLCVLIASVLWGTTGTAATLAPQLSPLAVGAATWCLGGLLLAVTTSRPIHRYRPQLLAQRRMLLIAGGSIALFPSAFYTSMRMSGVAVGTVVSIGSAPLIAAVIEYFADRKPLSRRWAVAACAGLLGVVGLAASRVHANPAGGGGAGTVIGVALGLVAGLLYAVFSWAAARMMHTGIPFSPVIGSTFGLGGLILLPMLLVTGAPILQSSGNTAVVAYLVVGPMLLGYLLFGRGLASTPASVATTLSLLEPAVATLIAVVFLGEELSLIGVLGITLLIVSVAVLTQGFSGQGSPPTADTGDAERNAALATPSGTSRIRQAARRDQRPLGEPAHPGDQVRVETCTGTSPRDIPGPGQFSKEPRS